MSTLVTGGTGFLGRRLVERLLARGREVAVLARHPCRELEERGVRFMCTSLEDRVAVRDACRKIETVFHVAARVGVWGRYEDYYRTNVLGTRALLAGCREHGVRFLVHTSTPSVVYNGRDLAGADETLPLTTSCPSPYPLTKAIAEREVLAANSITLRTVALRPHLIWGVGDPHLVPRLLERAASGRLRIIGDGKNRVDMVHVENAVDAHLLAEKALQQIWNRTNAEPSAHADSVEVRNVSGQAYFITNGEPVVLWQWINELLLGIGRPAVTKSIPLPVALAAGVLCEAAWTVFQRTGEPPITRFVAAELAKDHWFDLNAARSDLGYSPRISMAVGTAELIAALKSGT